MIICIVKNEVVFFQAYRNTVPVPRHWCFKRKYLQVIIIPRHFVTKHARDMETFGRCKQSAPRQPHQTFYSDITK